MRRIPTQAELEAMSEAELDAYLAGSPERLPEAIDPAARPRWTQMGGAGRAYAWLLVIGGVVGIAACWELMSAELTLIREPLATLTCDVNPLVSCGASLDTWQGNLLGVPNAFVGAMAFAVLTALGALLAAGARLPRWMWVGLCAATTAGAGFVVWFLGESILVFGKLCPFCMVIWAVMVPVWVRTVVQAGVSGHLGRRLAGSRRLWAARWWIVGAVYGAIVVAVVVGFWDGWVALAR